MKREENLRRYEKAVKVTVSNSNYLVYSSFHSELRTAIEKYARLHTIE